ncbi:MAG: DnaB-like helicase C-terminal domain-containing protein, partial [Thermodesulfobacteriota bacterium]|nr:DnaB-like helicase C-terminal domain-containing protein [Thermodesulfobacteriota bacterium]
DSTSTVAGVDHYVAIIKGHSKRRRLIAALVDAAESAYIKTKETDEILSTIKSQLREIDRDDKRKDLTSKEIAYTLLDDISTRRGTKGPLGVMSGLESIDDHIHGFDNGSMVLIMARPSIGKTALSLTMADSMATKGSVLYFSLDMGALAIFRRRLAAHTGILHYKIRAGDIDDSRWDKLMTGLEAIGDEKFIFRDAARYKRVENLVACAEMVALEHNITAVYVDHIQLMSTNKKTNSVNESISYISNELKSLAKNLNVPIFVLSQLNRSVENRTNKRPMLHDLRDSGALEQDANIVIGLYRNDKKSQDLEIAALKGQDTGTWEEILHYDLYTQKITDRRQDDTPYFAR